MTLTDLIYTKLLSLGIVMQGEVVRSPKVIVPISGGKDSQACLMLALNYYASEDILGLFNDTGFEHPLTYKHIETITSKYRINLITLQAGTVSEKCLASKRFPSGTAKHCTNGLKIRPSKFFYKHLAIEGKQGFEVWMGVRSEESKARELRYQGKISDELYTPNDFMSQYPIYLADLGVMIRLPVLDWSTEEIFNLLQGEENYLYSAGFKRVGCFPCLAGGEALKVAAFNFDEVGMKHYKIAEQISAAIGEPIFTTKKFGDFGCAICSI